MPVLFQLFGVISVLDLPVAFRLSFRLAMSMQLQIKHGARYQAKTGAGGRGVSSAEYFAPARALFQLGCCRCVSPWAAFRFRAGEASGRMSPTANFRWAGPS